MAAEISIDREELLRGVARDGRGDVHTPWQWTECLQLDIMVSTLYICTTSLFLICKLLCTVVVVVVRYSLRAVCTVRVQLASSNVRVFYNITFPVRFEDFPLNPGVAFFSCEGSPRFWWLLLC